MLGINGFELILLSLVAVLVLGPARLPEYAAQLAALVRGLRRIAKDGREQVNRELGTELTELDWKRLDPRRYDPRAIIRDALSEDLDDVFPTRAPAESKIPPGKKPSAISS